MDHVESGSSVSTLLLALWLVKQLKSRSNLRKHLSHSHASTFQKSSALRSGDETHLWHIAHIRRTCSFIYSLVGLREISIAGGVGVAIFARSLFDLKMVHLTSAVENAIVSRNPEQFRQALANFLKFMVPVSALNAILNYSINELALCLREKLSNRLLAKYTANNSFYRIGLLNRSANGQMFDQVLTHDLEEFTDAITGLFSHTLKPCVDVVIFAERLWSTFGREAPLSLGAYMVISGIVLNVMRSPVGQFAAGEQQMEGIYRNAVARLVEHAEQIASFGGGSRELASIKSYLQALVSYVRSFAQFRGGMSVIDGVASKYFLTYLGWIVVSRPFLDQGPTSRIHNKTSEEMYWHFHTVSKMMMNLSGAIGSLLLSGRDLVRCLGYSERICDFEDVLNSCTIPDTTHDTQCDNLTDSIALLDPSAALELTDVPLVTPTGEVLVSRISLTVHPGTCILITGPNGSGKSSLMRVLAGLWVPTAGRIRRSPATEMLQERSSTLAPVELVLGMMYLPQKPYLPIGTLRDQIVYPGHAPVWLKEKDANKEEYDHPLTLLLQKVQLGYLVEREGGWDAADDWSTVLSGGEKQRLSIARLLFHKPTFALLDESTSAVNEEVEDSLYVGCKNAGITFITVSHRRSLRKHHSTELRFDGHGAYQILPI